MKRPRNPPPDLIALALLANPALPSHVVERRLRVLIVDDEPAILRTMSQLWAHHKVSTAATVAEALGLLRSHDFEVVVSDYYLGNSLGDEVLAVARETQPGAYRILASGTSKAVFARLVDEGVAHRFVPKIEIPSLELENVRRQE